MCIWMQLFIKQCVQIANCQVLLTIYALLIFQELVKHEPSHMVDIVIRYIIVLFFLFIWMDISYICFCFREKEVWFDVTWLTFVPRQQDAINLLLMILERLALFWDDLCNLRGHFVPFWGWGNRDFKAPLGSL